MRYYLLRWESYSDGAPGTCWRPEGSTQADAVGASWSVIDLRPTGSNEGWCLLGTSHAITERQGRRIYLGDAKEAPNPTLKAAIQQRLGITCTATTLTGLVWELLLEHGDDARSDRWNRLRPTGLTYELWLGGELLDSQPAIRGGAVHTDSFTTADNGTLTGDLTWTEVSGTAWQIRLNQARHSTTGVAYARAEHDCAGSDNYAQATLNLIDAGNPTEFGICCRWSGSAVTNYYFEVAKNSGGTTSYRLRRSSDASNRHDVTSAVTEAVSTPVVVKVQASGSTIKGFLGGVEKASATDTNIATGLRGGIYGYSNNANVTFVDDFEVGDLGGAAEVTGTINTAFGALTATAVGTKTVGGTVATAFGAVAATAAGARVEAGTIATAFGALTATAAGLPTVHGTAAANLGALTATAAGLTTVGGTITTDFGGLAATAVTPGVAGTISTSFGGLTATAAGTRTVGGSVSTNLGGTGGGEGAAAGVQLAANRTTYRTSKALAHQL